jgi:hypothetical protein
MLDYLWDDMFHVDVKESRTDWWPLMDAILEVKTLAIALEIHGIVNNY